MGRLTSPIRYSLPLLLILAGVARQPVPAAAQERTAGVGLSERTVSGLRLLALTSSRPDQDAATAPVPFPDQEIETESLPWKAALASFAIPGSGQLMTGRSLGWGLLATEALLIGSGLRARHLGRAMKRDYERWADLYWDRDRYLDHLTYFESLTGSPWPYDHHALPPAGTRDHDYYEMIGKYDQFAPGWSDWQASWDVPWRGISRVREDYLGQRYRANRHLKWALTSGGLVFLNHLAAGTEVLFRGEGSRDRLPARARELTPWGAAGRSLLLPGWGQRLQGRRGAATTLAVCEGLFWLGLKGFSQYGTWKLEDSRRWAVRHAGVDPWLKDAEYYRVLSLYPDFVTYNAVQQSGLGTPEEVYPSGIGYEWRWDSEASWKRYRDLRRDSRLARSRARVVLSGIVAVRLIGAVTALIAGARQEMATGPGGEARRRVGERERFSVTLSPWMGHDPFIGTGPISHGKRSGLVLKVCF